MYNTGKNLEGMSLFMGHFSEYGYKPYSEKLGQEILEWLKEK